jgi:pectate lyase-like protein
VDIREVSADNTPNEGRLIWNANDKELADCINALALNVKTEPYNARGDGVTDDTNAIQSAMDDCARAGGGNVFLPTGTYLLQESLLLRNGVNIIGAGMYVTTLKVGDGMNAPAIIDDAVAKGSSASAFGKVHLSDFGIDGNQANNPSGQEGIFTSAYFSTFEKLFITGCGTHGMRMGFSGMSNASSQNRIVGCRIADCAGAGIYFDINGIDHTVSQNYIYNCNQGVVIRNGGVRVINNGIFNHQSASIRVEQTSYGLVIASNDLNGSPGNAIEITRSSADNGRTWGMFLISGNSILGDGLAADNSYHAIYVQTSVPKGIANLTIVGNKIFTLDGPNRFQYGVYLGRNVVQTKCAGNHIQGVATGQYYVGPSCTEIEIDSIGGGRLQSPALPPSGSPLTNPFHVPVTVYVAGGIVTEVAIDGDATGLTEGGFQIPAAHSITLTYTSAPNWTWFAH